MFSHRGAESTEKTEEENNDTCGATGKKFEDSEKKFSHRGAESTENTEENVSTHENANVGADLCVCPIPDVIIRKFRGIFFANAARNEFLAQELVKINQLMADNGIEMLNWKGPALAVQAYGDLSLRQFRDLDTFVKKEDLSKAKAIHLKLKSNIMLKFLVGGLNMSFRQ
jgi:hypothetical protein